MKMTIIGLEQHKEQVERQTIKNLVASQRAEIEEVEREIEALQYTLVLLQGELYQLLDSAEDEDLEDF
jgi:hypothetical protein